MVIKEKARGYFQFLLAMDCETSGMFFNNDDPSYNPKTQQTFQSVSWGLIVADALTFNPIESKYIEIKWNGESLWSKKAEQIHGLSLEHLEKYGITEEEAVVEISELILKYWGPEGNIRCLGHNVTTFDLWFLKRLTRKFDIDFKFGNRHIDVWSAGFATVGAYNSDDLFETFNYQRSHTHNALDDARFALQSIQAIRKLWNKNIGLSSYE